MNKNEFKQAAIQFQLAVHSIKHLLGYVSYSFDQVCFIESGTTKDHEFAATVVNVAWDAWLVQQRKLDAKDKLVIQQGQAFNDQSQKVKDLEYQLGLDFKLVNPDAVLVLAKVNFSKFHSADQMRNEIDHLHKAFKKAGKQVIVFDSGYSLEVLTDEQLQAKGLKWIHRGTLQDLKAL
ncbi:hypothetical protein [Acinetobacter junii]|uniref:hypothetical protein n=1 Tax=Acinetobacter junii TaxID=40215 RepID=UPI000950A69F|nr:hypothetical protein [Acinetobacter junii]APU48411.1 hypothetical protein BVL33_07840 [Acinetobacter junii]MDH0718328.1 hypothetical protein [Acinetobacter junii]MQZ57929.1 hypothetical protein [Acinetobacter junii]